MPTASEHMEPLKDAIKNCLIPTLTKHELNDTGDGTGSPALLIEDEPLHDTVVIQVCSKHDLIS